MLLCLLLIRRKFFLILEIVCVTLRILGCILCKIDLIRTISRIQFYAIGAFMSLVTSQAFAIIRTQNFRFKFILYFSCNWTLQVWWWFTLLVHISFQKVFCSCCRLHSFRICWTHSFSIGSLILLTTWLKLFNAIFTRWLLSICTLYWLIHFWFFSHW